MPIQFYCPKCSKRLSVPDSFVGKKARCPGCNETVDVPAKSQPEVAPAHEPHAAHDERPIIGDRPPIGESLAPLMAMLTPQMGRACFVVGFLLMVSGFLIWYVLGIIGLIVVALSLSLLIVKGEGNERVAALIAAGLIISALVYVLIIQIMLAGVSDAMQKTFK